MRRIIGLFSGRLGPIVGGAIVLALVGAGLLYAATAKEILIIVDGEEILITTHASRVASALKVAGVEPGPNDRVFPSPEGKLEAGVPIVVNRASDVILDLDGERILLSTANVQPTDILAQAGVQLFPGDRVWADGLPIDPSQPVDSKPFRLRLRRATSIFLEVDGETQEIRSAAPTLAEALWENGIPLYQGDYLEPSPDTALPTLYRVILQRSRPLQIAVDGQSYRTRVVADTVGEAMAQAGVALVGLDYAMPAVDQPLPLEGPVEVVRVQEFILTEQSPLAFGTLYQGDPELEIDNTRLVNPGSYGIQANRVRVRLENGLEAGRSVEGEWMIREPEHRVIGYGTKIVIRTLDTPDGPIEYWRAVDVWVTSYSPCRSGVDRCLYGTVSGLPVAKGILATIRSWYQVMKFQELYVPGYGFGIIADVGGGIPGRHWIDVGYSDDDYRSWSRPRTVYFLTPIPDEIMWILD
ncbi:MAG: ubiquitin-like domain-containing protein [Anaerolineales bacterium]|jgi:uncharacterized protein YabE (DUF348 family)